MTHSTHAHLSYPQCSRQVPACYKFPGLCLSSSLPGGFLQHEHTWKSRKSHTPGVKPSTNEGQSPTSLSSRRMILKCVHGCLSWSPAGPSPVALSHLLINSPFTGFLPFLSRLSTPSLMFSEIASQIKSPHPGPWPKVGFWRNPNRGGLWSKASFHQRTEFRSAEREPAPSHLGLLLLLKMDSQRWGWLIPSAKGKWLLLHAGAKRTNIAIERTPYRLSQCVHVQQQGSMGNSGL